MTDCVQRDSAVLVHYTLKLQDGTTAESTPANGKPALFRLGDGSLSQQLEQALLGLRCGERHSFVLAPEAAFGVVNPDMIQFFSSRDFAQAGIPEAGIIMLFSGIDGKEIPGVIREVSGDSVTVDFNHPLAGQTVQFEIEVVDINPLPEKTDANSFS